MLIFLVMFPSPFENMRASTASHCQKRTSVYAFQRQVFLAKNLLLHGTTDIHVRSEIPFSVSLLQIGGADTRSLAKAKRRRTFCTSSIFSSGTDAAGLNRSDISALPKFAMKSVHGRTLLMMRRRRCPAFPALLQIGGADTRREHKLTAGVSLIR